MSEHAPVCDHPLFTYQPDWARNQAASVAHVTRHADLSASPEALWAVLADPHSWADWLTVHQRWVGHPRARFVPGARMTAETLMLGVSNTVEWTVESAIAPGTLVLIGTGEAGMRTRLTFWVSAAEDGAKVTVTSEIAGDLLTDTITAAVERDGAEQLDRSISLLEDLAVIAAQRPARPALKLVHSAPEPAPAAPAGTGAQLRAVR